MGKQVDLRRREKARRRLAEEQGWSFSEWHDDLLRHCAAALGVDPELAQELNVVSGSLDGRDVTVFDVFVTEPPYAVRTVHLVYLPWMVPLVAVSRHGVAADSMVPMLKRLVAERQDRHLYETGDPVYDAVHVVETLDPETAALLLTPAVREYADDRRWHEWQVDGSYLFYAEPEGAARADDDSQEVLAQLRSLAGLVDLMDPRLWGDHADMAPAARTAVADTEDPESAAERPGTGPSAMFRGGPAHTGAYPQGIRPAGFEAWSVRLPDAVAAEPVVCAGTVYVNCADGRCYALDAVSGRPRWSFDTHAPLRRSPAVADGTVYVVGESGLLHALSADTGEERWLRRVGHSGDPVVADGVVFTVHHPAFLLRDASRVTALDAATGDERWRARLPEGSAAGAAVADGRVFVQGARAELTALDAASGEELWHQGSAENQLSCCTPSVADGVVVTGSGLGRLYAWDAATGERLWRAQASGVLDNTAARGDGVVYAGDSHGGLYAVNSADGSPLWHLPNRYGASSPALCGFFGWLVSTKAQRSLFRIGLTTGRVLWRHKLDGPGTSPVYADGVVHVGTGAGTVLALDAETGHKPARARRAMPV
ncbi:outer membrane protein assembly factor BamB family protein [Streptomyces sp. NPDC002676]